MRVTRVPNQVGTQVPVMTRPMVVSHRVHLAEIVDTFVPRNAVYEYSDSSRAALVDAIANGVPGV